MLKHYRLSSTKILTVETRWTPWHVGLGVSFRRMRVRGCRGARVHTWHLFARLLWLELTLGVAQTS